MDEERILFPIETDLEKLGKPPGVIGFCPTCGQPVVKRSGKGRQKIFCSKVCCDRYSYLNRGSRSWSGKKTKTCEYCGAEFTAYRENSYTQRYCSVRCARHAVIERNCQIEGSETLCSGKPKLN
jgi:endogenous inhibitor of DNA gyrase (YacG/DUF329 family)